MNQCYDILHTSFESHKPYIQQALRRVKGTQTTGFQERDYWIMETSERPAGQCRSRADADNSTFHDVYHKICQLRAENRAGLREKCSAGMHVYRVLPSPQVNWDGCIMICNFSLHQNRFVIDKKHWQTFHNRTKIKLCTNKWLIYSFNCSTALIQNLCSVTNPKALLHLHYMSHPL